MFAAPEVFRFHARVRAGGWKKHWVQDLIGAALAISVGMCILTTRPFSLWFEKWSYDLPYRFRPDVMAEGVVVVSIDEASRSALGQEDANRWDRQLHANLLDRLVARGARAVAFTTVFSHPSGSGDQTFAQALRRARGKVVLAAGATNGVVQPPLPEFSAVAPWGLLVAPGGADGVVRRHPPSAANPALAFRLAQLTSRTLTNATSSRWMRYYSPALALTTLSYEQVLRGAEPSGALKGKLVIVSADSPESESFPTPYTLWTGRRATRPEIEATAVLNLSRREWLARWAPGVEALVLMVAGGFFGLVFMGRQRGAIILLAVGGALLVFAGGYLLFAGMNVWFPWLIVAGVQIPVAAGWAWFCESMERPIATPGFPTETSPAPTAPPAPPAANPRPALPVLSLAQPSIPDHTLVKCIGRGAYGEVWLARNVIGRHQAVKIVKARNFTQPAPYEREFKGIERFASVSRSHPGLVQVLHVGRNDASGYFFYIMELADDVSGATTWEPERYSPKTLAGELERRGHLPVQECLQIGVALCAALQHLHERQLVHRDIKPTNIIFVEGRVKVADIGLVARIASNSREMTQLGTEGYLAPEGPGTPLADLYALGKVLYEISMGRDRWQFPEFPTTIGTRPDQADLRRLHEIILTACETVPEQRFQSARAMQEALTRLQAP